MPTQIQLRRGTASQWTSANPVLAGGEAGVETDTGQVKFGDGVTAWADLPYTTDNATSSLGAGALVRLNSNVSIPHSTFVDVPWDAADYDDDGFWTSGSPTRLTVPSGVSRVRLVANIELPSAGSSDAERFLRFRKNGDAALGLGQVRANGMTSNVALNLASASMEVVAGDYFTMQVRQQTGSAIDLQAGVDRTFFAIEVVR